MKSMPPCPPTFFAMSPTSFHIGCLYFSRSSAVRFSSNSCGPEPGVSSTSILSG